MTTPVPCHLLVDGLSATAQAAPAAYTQPSIPHFGHRPADSTHGVGTVLMPRVDLLHRVSERFFVNPR